jgi:hypothetical protein
MKNAEWMIQNGYKFINLRAFDADNANRAYKICLRMEDYTWKWIGEVNKVYNDRSTAVFTWLDMEHKEPILDDAEKKYLSAVIKPFRDNVKLIAKADDFDKSYIFITFVNDADSTMFFPYFKKGTMYKGMSDKMYTLEELGL